MELKVLSSGLSQLSHPYSTNEVVIFVVLSVGRRTSANVARASRVLRTEVSDVGVLWNVKKPRVKKRLCFWK